MVMSLQAIVFIDLTWDATVLCPVVMEVLASTQFTYY